MLSSNWKVFVVALILTPVSRLVVAEQPTRPVIPVVVPPGSVHPQPPRP